MVENLDCTEHFFVYAESDLGAGEKALLEMKVQEEDIPDNDSDVWYMLKLMGWLVYGWGEEIDESTRFWRDEFKKYA